MAAHLSVSLVLRLGEGGQPDVLAKGVHDRGGHTGIGGEQLRLHLHPHILETHTHIHTYSHIQYINKVRAALSGAARHTPRAL